jgi:hypothetical protein
MLAQQSLRRPVSGQEFESLCLKLWGEIWKCPEIQKVGRSGQSQNGVDIVGTPAGEQGYWGIQCKGKSEYNDDQYQHPQFSEAEIDREIEEAKGFEPALRKLYFATTARRDSKTQAYIRKRNEALKKEGLFEVHLFSWEDIVDRIDENRATYDWYAKNQKYRLDVSIRPGASLLFGKRSIVLLSEKQ